MYINKSDLPYLYQEDSEWVSLPNGIEHQTGWAYSIYTASMMRNLGEDDQPVLIEALYKRHHYRFPPYLVTVSEAYSWHYLDFVDISYAELMLGYRNYWRGEIYENNEMILQPEAAILLGFTHDFEKIPGYIETLSLAELTDLLNEAKRLYKDDDAIAFQKPLPIETPVDAPNSIFDAMRRTRAQTGLTITRGRADMIEFVMKRTGIMLEGGSWRLRPEEVSRRQALGLR